jgi:hypothetical protein
MPEQKPRLSDQSAKWIGSFVSVVTNLVAVPIKEMHQTIGHSFVSGMTILGLIAGGVAMYAIERQEERLAPVSAGLVQSYAASTESTRLRNVEKEAQLGQGVNRSEIWSLVAINSDVVGRVLEIEFPPVEGAVQLVVSWRVINSPTADALNREGLALLAIPSGGLATVVLPWSEVWQEGDSIGLTMEQLTDDGRRIRNTQIRTIRL